MTDILLTKIMKLPPVGTEDESRDWVPVTVKSGAARYTGRTKYPIGEYDAETCGYCHGEGVIECPTCHGTGTTPTGVEACPTCRGAKTVECPTCHGQFEKEGCISVDEDGVIRLHVDGHSIRKTAQGLSTALCDISRGLRWNDEDKLEVDLYDEKKGLTFNPTYGNLEMNVDETMFTFDEDGKLQCILKLVGQQFDYDSSPITIDGENEQYNFVFNEQDPVQILDYEDIDGSAKFSVECTGWQTNNQVFNVEVGIKNINNGNIIVSDNMTIDTTRRYNSVTVPVHYEGMPKDTNIVPFILFDSQDIPKVAATMTTRFTGLGISK